MRKISQPVLFCPCIGSHITLTLELFKTESERERVPARAYCVLTEGQTHVTCCLTQQGIYMTSHSAGLWAALFNRCTAWSDLAEVPRLEITSFWSKFHQSKWLPQSRLLFHVCDLKKPLICIKCPKYIHKTSIQWTPELLFWTPPGS